jgi:Ca2+-binding RTX toxin-like protein
MRVINGTARSDKLTGTAVADTLLGLDGHDIIKSLGGHDILDGGLGNDTLAGGLGNDTYIVDQRGDKVVESGGQGIDTVNASITYTLTSHVEILLLGGTGAIDGTGNSLGNTLAGNSGNNTLSGLAGDDIINGGAGNDTLIGGRGTDILTGGNGNDTFRYLDGDLTNRTKATADRIADFTAGEHIDLSRVDALVAASEYFADGKQKFHFIGQNNFHIHSGTEIRYEISGGNTYVYGSINGDAVADFVIRLDGVHALTVGDFIF